MGNLLPIVILNSICNEFHILISDLQNKVIDLAFIFRKYNHITS